MMSCLMNALLSNQTLVPSAGEVKIYMNPKLYKPQYQWQVKSWLLCLGGMVSCM